MMSKINQDGRGDLGSGASGGQRHPLLIPSVVKNVFSNLGRNDLLTTRGVCEQWNSFGTEAYVNRAYEKTFTVSTMYDQFTIWTFIKEMSPSKRIPIARFFIRIDPLSIVSETLLQLLTFISPFVRFLTITFMSWPIRPRGNKEYQGEELLSLLDTMDPASLRMPELKEFNVMGGDYAHTFPFRRVVVKLTQTIVLGSPSLTNFGYDFPFEHKDGIIQALPRGLKELHFVDLSVLCRGATRDVPYPAFRDCGFQLEELRDMRPNQNGLAMIVFLSQQKDTLNRVHVDKLESVYGQCYNSLPQLKRVDKARFEVNGNTTFDFLTRFPNLMQLSINVTPLKPGIVTTRVNEIQNAMSCLPQHPSVRKLYIPPYLIMKQDMAQMLTSLSQISFAVLVHCFPNVTHLYIPTSGSARLLTSVFTHFPNLEWLCINVCHGDPRPREWESVLSGIPIRMCKAMVSAGNYEGLDEGTSPGTGLTNLNSKDEEMGLRTLEVGDKNHSFDFIFTDLMFHRVFARMTSLKEICLVKEEKIPQVCLPFVEPLRTKGMTCSE